MAESGTVITLQGLRLLADAQTGVKIEFSKVVFGDGYIEGELEAVTSLVSPKMDANIQSIVVTGDGQSCIRVLITNQNLDVGFFIREIGIYARDKDGNEILYSIVYYGDKATWLRPRGGTEIVEYMHDLITVVGNAQNVTAVIDRSTMYATLDDLDKLRALLCPPPIDGGMFGDAQAVLLDGGVFTAGHDTYLDAGTFPEPYTAKYFAEQLLLGGSV